jgi:hypothetical protein
VVGVDVDKLKSIGWQLRHDCLRAATLKTPPVKAALGFHLSVQGLSIKRTRVSAVLVARKHLPRVGINQAQPRRPANIVDLPGEVASEYANLQARLPTLHQQQELASVVADDHEIRTVVRASCP